MGETIAVGSASAVSPGAMQAFDVNGQKITIANVGGTFYAISDVCTHQRCPLSKGELEGTTVTCPCHGSQFDVTTGAVLNGPAEDPVQSYPVTVEGDSLQVSA